MIPYSPRAAESKISAPFLPVISATFEPAWDGRLFGLACLCSPVSISFFAPLRRPAQERLRGADPGKYSALPLDCHQMP